MKVRSSFSGGARGWHTACGAALLTALFAVVPFRAFADQATADQPAANKLAQADAIAAARKTLVAQRSAPQA